MMGTIDMIKSSGAAATKALSLPSHCINAYGDFITKNASAVSQIESGLRSLTYIIPGRFRESELASESVHSGVQLLSLYHDSLLSRAVARLPHLRSTQPPSAHARYTKYWTTKSTLYRRLAVFLQTIQYTELLWEMTAKRRGEKVRRRVVVLLEFIKAICRLLLLRLTNSRPLLSPPLPEREIDPSALEETGREQSSVLTLEGAEDDLTAPPSEKSTSSNDAKWTMPRTGLTLPSLPQASDVSDFLLSKVVTADDVKPPPTLLHRVTGKGEVAEWMYILRPVIFALAMQHWASDKKSWRPWLVGVSVEYGARQLAKQGLRERVGGGLRGLSGLEKEELRKRGWALGWWTMRGAFYENITKSIVQSVAGKLRGKMLLDMVSVIIDDYEFLWEEYHFSTATM